VTDGSLLSFSLVSIVCCLYPISQSQYSPPHRIFTKQWNAQLEVKRAEEFEEEKNARESAKEELSNWHTQRGIRLTAKKDSNRSEEQVLVETLESEAEVLKTWERVTKLIDASSDVADASKGSDVSRMRKLFIQLKNEPLETTRGAAAVEAK
jgi:hypothetical protein